MKTNKNDLGTRRVLVTLIFYLSVILVALLIVAFPQIAGVVAAVAILLSLFRLVGMFSWGLARKGYSWRV